MRPGFLKFIACTFLLGAIALGVAPLYSTALPLPNWLAVTLGALGLALAAISLRYASLKDQRDRDDRDDKRRHEEQERAQAVEEALRRQQTRAAWLAQFKELPVDEAAHLAGRFFRLRVAARLGSHNARGVRSPPSLC